MAALQKLTDCDWFFAALVGDLDVAGAFVDEVHHGLFGIGHAVLNDACSFWCLQRRAEFVGELGQEAFEA